MLPTAGDRAPSSFDASAPPRRSRAAWARALAYSLLIMLAAVLGAGFVITTFGRQTYHWRAFDIDVALLPSLRGETRLVFVPLGEVRAPTHRVPAALQVSLHGIYFEEMKEMAARPPSRQVLEADFTRAARRDLQAFTARQVLLGAAGGLLAVLILRPRRARYWALAIAAGSGFVALVFYGAMRTFDGRAFESPTYTGSLRQAKWAIALAKDAFARADTLSGKLRGVAANLEVLYSRINALPNLAGDLDTIRVLPVSDIHNNPMAVDFVREIVTRMHVDVVIDTGDLTDFGTPLEANLSRGMGSLGVPHVFVAGNHDSQATLRDLRARPNSVIVDGTAVSVAGLSVLGAPDPSAARRDAGSVDTAPERLRAAGEALLASYRQAAIRPDIVAVHDPRQAEALVGTARVVLCGHTHQAALETRLGTVVCNAGTTGAAGARYFDAAEGVPLSAALLTFSRSPHPRLLFVDQIRLDGGLGQYSIARRPYNTSLGR